MICENKLDMKFGHYESQGIKREYVLTKSINFNNGKRKIY